MWSIEIFQLTKRFGLVRIVSKQIGEFLMFGIEEGLHQNATSTQAIFEANHIGQHIFDSLQTSLWLACHPVHSIYMVGKYLFAEGFVGQSRELGHEIGPFGYKRLKETLAPGMTLAAEAFMTRPNVGTIGFERNFIVTDSGAEVLDRTPMLFW